MFETEVPVDPELIPKMLVEAPQGGVKEALGVGVWEKRGRDKPENRARAEKNRCRFSGFMTSFP